MITVTATSTILIKVYSHHKSQTDKVMAEGRISIQSVISSQPPNCQTANIPVKLVKPKDLVNEQAEDICEEELAKAILHVQIKEWPVFVTAANRILENEPSTVTSPSAHRTSITPSTASSYSGGDQTGPLPNQWSETQDAHTGKTYYVDHLTKTTQWERPKSLHPNWERRLDQENNRVYFVDHVNRKTQWTHPAENVQQTATRRTNNVNRYNARYMPGQDDDDAPSEAPLNDDFNALNIIPARGSVSTTGSVLTPVNPSELPYPLPSTLTPTNASTTPTRSPKTSRKKGFTVLRKNVGQETFGKSISRQGSIDDNTAVDINEIDKRFGKLEEPWEAKKQPNTGRCYYVNHRTKTSQWEDPRTFGLELTLRPPDGWQATTASDGTRYFINHTTKRTSWDPWQAENVPKKEDVYTRKAMSYMDKYSMFTRMCGFNSPEGHLKVPLKRERIFQSSFQYFMQDILLAKKPDAKVRHPGDYRKRLFIQFGNEEGLDYGGVSREFFYLLSNDIANPEHGMFEQSPNYSLRINPNSAICISDEYDHLLYYRFVGRIVAIGMYHKRFLDCGFSLPFYKRLLNKSIHLSDIADVDEDYYKSLLWMMENEIDELDMGITFTATQDNFGKIEEVDLKPGGSEIDVDESNKEEYVKLMVNWRFEKGVNEQMDSIIEGVKDIVPIEWLQVFDEHDLEVALCGISKLDVTDWKKHTLYKNYNATDKTIQWFWLWLERCTEDEKSRLLQFVTGTCRIPNGGFADLIGSNGPQRFCIEKTGKIEWLPKSHTCFNRLDLPAYPSYDKLKEKLHFAINECSTGFGQE